MHEPLHIDQIAAQLLRLSCEAYEKIMARRHEMDAQGRFGDTLHIIVGENHMGIFDQFANIKLMNLLKQAESSFGLSFERQHNYLKDIFQEYSVRSDDNALLERLISFDKSHKEHMTRKAELALNNIQYAPYLSFSKMNWALEEDVSVFHIDAARMRKAGDDYFTQYIDLNDPLTRELAREALGEEFNAASLYDCRTPDGMKIRNYHMMSLAQSTDLRINFIPMGAWHSFVRPEDVAYRSTEDTFTSYMKHSGADFIVIGMSDLRSEDGKALRDINGFSEDNFFGFYDVPELSAFYDEKGGADIDALIEQYQMDVQVRSAEDEIRLIEMMIEQPGFQDLHPIVKFTDQKQRVQQVYKGQVLSLLNGFSSP